MLNYAALLVAGASATSFSSFDPQHTHCEMFVSYENVTCDTIYTELLTELRSWAYP